jgi:bifunctional isochorismate lyase/aryl carrier protein
MAISSIESYPLPSRAELPKSRLAWRPEAKRSALLIHDLQDYFLDPYDREISPCAPMLRNVERLVRFAERLGIPLFFSAQPGEQSREERGLLWDLWGPGIVRRPERRTIVSSLFPRESAKLIEKKRYSAFFETALLEELRNAGRDQLFVTGVYAHIGCLTTVVDAFMHGIQPFAVADAMADFSCEDHAFALRQVAKTSGVVLVVESALASLAISKVREVLFRVLPELPEELSDEEDLLDAGLDSIRFLMVIEALFAPGELDFDELSRAQNIRALARELVSVVERGRRS